MNVAAAVLSRKTCFDRTCVQSMTSHHNPMPQVHFCGLMAAMVMLCTAGGIAGVHVNAQTLSGPPATTHSEGLRVPGLTDSGRLYSDLLWTKEDYRAWSQGTGYRHTARNEAASVFPFSFVAEPVEPPAGAMSQWQFGERNWQYAADSGLAVRLGSSDVGSSVLTGNATLGGLHIRQSDLVDQHDGSWSVSFALGALDYSSDDKGDLAYGPAAANTVINYGLNEHVALESAVQVAPDMVTTTLGGRFDAGDLGRLRAGVAHGSLGEHDGWRYQAAYDIELAGDVRLSVRNEWDAPGFADLAHYRGGVASGVRRNWQATVPTRHWGDISGTYETFQPTIGSASERFGFTQQFWYSPNLRIGLQAQREVGTGDYDIGIRFSVPIN